MHGLHSDAIAEREFVFRSLQPDDERAAKQDFEDATQVEVDCLNKQKI